MQVTLLRGILLAVWALITGTDKSLEAFFIFRPIIVATGTGIILGDPVTGAIVGGLTELAFAGLTPVGGAVPPDPLIAGLMGAVFAITSNVTPTAAVGLAIPFCILMQYIVVVINSVYVFWLRFFDHMAEDCNVSGLIWLQVAGATLYGAVYAVFTFLSAYVMQNAIRDGIHLIPTWFMNGLSVAGGVMPALGFGMLLLVMFKVRYLPFLIIGFLAATFMKYDNLLPVALIGTAFAMYNYFFVGGEKKDDGEGQTGGGGEDVGI